MSEFRSKWEQFTDSTLFDWLVIAAGVLLSVLLIGGVVWAVQSTNGPAYEPQQGERR